MYFFFADFCGFVALAGHIIGHIISWRGGIGPVGILPAGMDGNGVTVLGGIGRTMNGRKMNGRKIGSGTPMTTTRQMKIRS